MQTVERKKTHLSAGYSSSFIFRCFSSKQKKLTLVYNCATLTSTMWRKEKDNGLGEDNEWKLKIISRK